ncbi:MAG: DNA repair protein RecO [Eubacteriales bacterium]
MQELVTITGMILKTVPIGEYDRRLVILTKERGKITAFAKGARRQNSRLLATTNYFCFGEFKLYQGRNSYTLMEANISNYFEELRIDFESAYYGMYFMEVMDYYTRENNDEKEMLKLLYQSLRALLAPGLSHILVRYIFEIKAMVINGEFPGIPMNMELEEDTKYTINYIVNSEISKLFTFRVADVVLSQLKSIADRYRRMMIDYELKSLEILESLISS